MDWLFGCEERPPAPWWTALDRLIVGVLLVLCFALWASSTEVLVVASRHDGGRTVACHYFTGTRMVQWQFSGGTGREGCPIVRKGR